MSELLGTIWVCICCLLSHANGECCDSDSHGGDGREPLSLIGEGYSIALGISDDEHADECGRGEECDCDRDHYSTRTCEGCGSALEGERHAMTLFNDRTVGRTMTVKQSFTITFTDRVSATVHSEQAARDIVTGNYDASRFAPGTIDTVTRHISEWHGDHDKGTRGFARLLSVDMPLNALRIPHADYPHESGRLYDCPSCEAACWCGDLRTETPCIYCGECD
jgi:hypothetical protein